MVAGNRACLSINQVVLDSPSAQGEAHGAKAAPVEQAVGFSPDGRSPAWGAVDGTVIVCDVERRCGGSRRTDSAGESRTFVYCGSASLHPRRRALWAGFVSEGSFSRKATCYLNSGRMLSGTLFMACRAGSGCLQVAWIPEELQAEVGGELVGPGKPLLVKFEAEQVTCVWSALGYPYTGSCRSMSNGSVSCPA